MIVNSAHLRTPFVPPHVGGWIEIVIPIILPISFSVPPHVGGWIEMELNNITEKTYYGPASCRRVD